MKKLSKLFLLAVILFTLNGAVSAQSLKIGYVDSNEIMALMPEKQTVETQLADFQKQLESELMTMATEYQNKLTEYQENLSTMSNLIRQSKEKELTDLQTRIQEFQQNAEYEFSDKRTELLTPVIDKVKKAIEAVGKDNGFTYVLDSATGVLLYIGDAAENVTPLVKAKLGIQ